MVVMCKLRLPGPDKCTSNNDCNYNQACSLTSYGIRDCIGTKLAASVCFFRLSLLLLFLVIRVYFVADVCIGVQCGLNANCIAKHHIGDCKCMLDYVGNAYDLAVGCTGKRVPSIPRALFLSCEVNDRPFVRDSSGQMFHRRRLYRPKLVQEKRFRNQGLFRRLPVGSMRPERPMRSGRTHRRLSVRGQLHRRPIRQAVWMQTYVEFLSGRFPLLHVRTNVFIFSVSRPRQMSIRLRMPR